MKKLGLIAGIALAIAVLLTPEPAIASPVPGIWTGLEKKHWTGKKWQPYSEQIPLSFRIDNGKVVHFNTTSNYVWPGCTGGKTVTAKLPVARTARVRRGRFSAERTTQAGSRKMTTSISGHFTSMRQATGTILVRLAGCPDYRSVWTAQSGAFGGFHTPICRGSNVVMPDGSFYYNPCAYIARKP